MRAKILEGFKVLAVFPDGTLHSAWDGHGGSRTYARGRVVRRRKNMGGLAVFETLEAAQTWRNKWQKDWWYCKRIIIKVHYRETDEWFRLLYDGKKEQYSTPDGTRFAEWVHLVGTEDL